MLPHQAADAIAFRTQHQGDVAPPARPRPGLPRRRPPLRCARSHAYRRVVQGAGDIHHFDIGHGFQRAGGRLGQRARLRRGMAVLHHHGRHAEGGSGAQDGARHCGDRIAGPAPARSCGGHRRPASSTSSRSPRGQRLGFQGRALVHRAWGQKPGNRFAIGQLRPGPGPAACPRWSRRRGWSEPPGPACGGDWPGRPGRRAAHKASFPAWRGGDRLGSSASPAATRFSALFTSAWDKNGAGLFWDCFGGGLDAHAGL